MWSSLSSFSQITSHLRRLKRRTSSLEILLVCLVCMERVKRCTVEGNPPRSLYKKSQKIQKSDSSAQKSFNFWKYEAPKQILKPWRNGRWSFSLPPQKKPKQFWALWWSTFTTGENRLNSLETKTNHTKQDDRLVYLLGCLRDQGKHHPSRFLHVAKYD